MKKLIILFFIFLMGIPASSDEFIKEKLNEQDELLNSISSEMMTMRLIISDLQNNNLELSNDVSEMQSTIENCNNLISSLEENISILKTALSSNSEDTNEVLLLLGEIQSEVNFYKKIINECERKSNRTNVFIQVLIPSTTIPLTISGIYLYTCTDYKNLGKMCSIYGASTFVGAELIWNGGKFIFKLW